MELQKFVQQTIEEIVNGIADAKNSLGDGVVDPLRQGAIASYQKIHDIDFDVAVTVEEKNGSDVKGKISVFGYGVGGGINSDKSSSTVTRIKFIVPVAYPGKNNAEN